MYQEHNQQQQQQQAPPQPQHDAYQEPRRPPAQDAASGITNSMANVSVANAAVVPAAGAPNSVAPNPGAAAGDPQAVSPEMQEFTDTIEKLSQRQQVLQEQIKQSEHNLSAQRTVLDQQRESQLQKGLYVARGEMLKKQAEDLYLNPVELADLLQPIRENCTKDSISAGKLWIFKYGTDSARNIWIANYLNYDATSYTAPFAHKLHIIYLMNDVLHSCQRKGSVELKEELQRVLVPMFCHAATTAPEDKRPKLEKLLSLWEGKLDLSPAILSQLQQPHETWAQVEKQFQEEFPEVVTAIAQHLDSTFDGYQQQHQAFVQHAMSQLQQLQQQRTQLEQKMEQHQQLQQQQQQLQQQQQAHSTPPDGINMAAPPGFHNSGPMFDFSKPPPGFNSGNGAEPPSAQTQPTENKENLVPTVPYFELPAGLMCPMVPDHETKYRPLDPTKLRLPPPAPPTERLLKAVENFYLPPSHEHPRNSEGWEQLSLYDYFKNKSDAVTAYKEMLEDGDRTKTPSPEPVSIQPPPQEKGKEDAPIRRYRSESPEKPVVLKPANERTPPEEPPTPSRGGSSPPHRRPENEYRPPYSPPRRSPSRSPPPRSSYRRHSPPSTRRSPPSARRSPPSTRRSRTRSRSRTPPMSRGFRRSPSRSPSPRPPRFAAVPPPDPRLGESNKGHQMLRRMGWGGTGLGRDQQGIEVPIDAGDVRDDPQERFRGLGVSPARADPFEAFRKNKGRMYVGRMKMRSDDLPPGM